ncbi:MAG: hypothetical protein K6G08_09760, partial [Prevotella sp.]|nr:hypothetical protein [Prevotella sp.]
MQQLDWAATCPEPDEGDVRKIQIRENCRKTGFLEKHRFEGGKGHFDPKSGAVPSSKLSFPFLRNVDVKKIHNPIQSCMVHNPG